MYANRKIKALKSLLLVKVLCVMHKGFENNFAERLTQVRARIAGAVKRSGRQAEDVTLIAVSKTHPVDSLRLAIDAGIADFGENRVQEAAEKIEALSDAKALANNQVSGHDNSSRWHLIGHLQANKARRAVKIFDCVHSVDSVELIVRLERLCIEENRSMLPVFAQIDLANEATKSGAKPEALNEIIEAVRRCERIKLIGFMTLPPFAEDAETVRPYFRQLRGLRDEWAGREAFSDTAFGNAQGLLSMGMSHDFEIAIEEGATHLRIGTQLFGTRA